jgi:hypothetical protein
MSFLPKAGIQRNSQPDGPEWPAVALDARCAGMTAGGGIFT